MKKLLLSKQKYLTSFAQTGRNLHFILQSKLEIIKIVQLGVKKNTWRHLQEDDGCIGRWSNWMDCSTSSKIV